MKRKLTNHFVNGDVKTNYFEDLIYVIFFIFEILKDKRAIQNEAHFDNFKKYYNLENDKNFFLRNAPSRILCEFFLFNWLKNNFDPKKKINILDVGCGSVVALKIFQKFFKEINYFGCDYKERENWEELKKNGINLFKYEIGENFVKDLPEIDLVHSQSVFEHVKYDLSGFEILSKKFKKAKHIHFLPAPLSFLNYEKHGYRRYAFKDLTRLKKILNDDKVNIYNIGGKNAFNYHFNFLKNNKFKKFKMSKFFQHYEDFDDSFKMINFLIFDKLKSFPVFYALEF